MESDSVSQQSHTAGYTGRQVRNGSTMITSQLQVDSWYNFIDETTPC